MPRPAWTTNPRDVLRIVVGGLLLLTGGYRLLFSLFAVFEALVDYDVSSDAFTQVAVAEFGSILLALAALLAGLGIIFRKARGTCAVLCAAGALGEAFVIYDADFEARVWNYSLSPIYIIFHSIYLGIFLLGFIYLFLPQRRSILVADAGTQPPQTLNDSNWRAWLLASLRDTGVAAPPDHFWKAALAFVGIAVIIGGATLVGDFVLPSVPILSIVWIIFAIAVLARLRNLFMRRLWQARARSADKELQRAGGRRPVLYLRSFALDAQLAKPSLLERLLGLVPLADAEQVLTKELRRCGPVIAIGRPSEALPALGAARFYITNERWKEKVADIVKVAELVVWATGTTEGLRWEISHLLESLPPEKLILWAHPHLLRVSEKEREAEWTRFRDTLGRGFPQPLPERLGDARFIYFNAQHEPVLVPPTSRWNAQRNALRALLRAKGYPKPDPIAKARRRRRWIIVLAAVFGVNALLVGGASIAEHLHAQKEQAKRDADAWNDLAFDFYYAEGSAGEDDAGKTLAEIKGVPDELRSDLSPAMMAQVTPVANDYIAIFTTAHDHPDVEPLLYDPNHSLIYGVASLDDAKQRRADVAAVSAAAAKFLDDWARVHTIMAVGAATYGIDGFEKRTKARIDFLDSEAAMLQFLIDHPQGWTSMQYKSGISLPTYQDATTEQALIKTMAARDTAMQTLKPLLPN
jgi:hypothetical protein